MKLRVFLLAALLPGCALTEKADVLPIRLFSPPLAEAAPRPIDDPPAAPPAVQLGRIGAATYLRSKIAYRVSNEELGVYEDRLWTERPETYLDRALASRLFVKGGAREVVAGTDPVLDAELLAFEEVRRGRDRIGRATVHVSLHDDECVWLSETLTRDEKAASTSPDAVVVAIGNALGGVSDDIAKRVEGRLREGRPETCRH